MDKSDFRILIVEDSLKNIQVLGSVLREEGFQLNVAQNGRQALEMVPKVHPDLILLDVMMPVMDGFETCERLKSNTETKDIPVIFLTAKVETEDVVKGLQLGAVDYITKPFNATELLTRIGTHLTIRYLKKESEQRVCELEIALKGMKRLQKEQDSFLRHELNNMIGPIMGFADLLLSYSINELDEKQRKWVTNIRQGSVKMRDLILALKKLQDLEQGNYVLDMEICDLEMILFQVIKDLELVWGDQVKIKARVLCDPIQVKADRSLLPGVFVNLIKNAIEHVVSLPDQHKRSVLVTLSKEQEKAIVTINNGGPPIQRTLLESFFERFNSSNNKKGGNGLGTTYAYVVIKTHNGEISVTSNETDGTTLTIKLATEPVFV